MRSWALSIAAAATAAGCAGPVEHSARLAEGQGRPVLLGVSGGAVVALSHEGGSFLLELRGGEVQALEGTDEAAFSVGERVFRLHAHSLRDLLPGGREGRSDKEVLNEQLAWESASIRAALEESGRLHGTLLLRVTRHRTKTGVPFLVWDYAFPSEDGNAPGEVYGLMVHEERLLSLGTALANLDDGDKSRAMVIDVLERVELRPGALELEAERERVSERDRAAHRESFEKAKERCRGGAAVACGDVGYRYLFGNNGATEDFGEARSYLQRACDANEARSCLGLAGMFVSALGVPKDLPKARALLKKACRLKLAQACRTLESLNDD